MQGVTQACSAASILARQQQHRTRADMSVKALGTWLSPALVRRACIRWLQTRLKIRQQGTGRTSERR